MRVDSFEKLKKALPSLQQEVCLFTQLFSARVSVLRFCPSFFMLFYVFFVFFRLFLYGFLEEAPASSVCRLE